MVGEEGLDVDAVEQREAANATRRAYLASPEGVLATRAEQLSGDYGYTTQVKPENVMAIQGIIEQLGGKESGPTNAIAASLVERYGITNLGQLGVRQVPGVEYQTIDDSQSGGSTYQVEVPVTKTEFYNKVTNQAIPQQFASYDDGKGTYHIGFNSGAETGVGFKLNHYNPRARGFFKEEFGQALLNLASVIPSPIQPFAVAAKVGMAVDEGDWGKVALNLLPYGVDYLAAGTDFVGSDWAAGATQAGKMPADVAAAFAATKTGQAFTNLTGGAATGLAAEIGGAATLSAINAAITDKDIPKFALLGGFGIVANSVANAVYEVTGSRTYASAVSSTLTTLAQTGDIERAITSGGVAGVSTLVNETVRAATRSPTAGQIAQMGVTSALTNTPLKTDDYINLGKQLVNSPEFKKATANAPATDKVASGEVMFDKDGAITGYDSQLADINLKDAVQTAGVTTGVTTGTVSDAGGNTYQTLSDGNVVKTNLDPVVVQGNRETTAWERIKETIEDNLPNPNSSLGAVVGVLLDAPAQLGSTLWGALVATGNADRNGVINKTLGDFEKWAATRQPTSVSEQGKILAKAFNDAKTFRESSQVLINWATDQPSHLAFTLASEVVQNVMTMGVGAGAKGIAKFLKAAPEIAKRTGTSVGIVMEMMEAGGSAGNDAYKRSLEASKADVASGKMTQAQANAKAELDSSKAALSGAAIVGGMMSIPGISAASTAAVRSAFGAVTAPIDNQVRQTLAKNIAAATGKVLKVTGKQGALEGVEEGLNEINIQDILDPTKPIDWNKAYQALGQGTILGGPAGGIQQGFDSAKAGTFKAFSDDLGGPPPGGGGNSGPKTASEYYSNNIASAIRSGGGANLAKDTSALVAAYEDAGYTPENAAAMARGFISSGSDQAVRTMLADSGLRPEQIDAVAPTILDTVKAGGKVEDVAAKVGDTLVNAGVLDAKAVQTLFPDATNAYKSIEDRINPLVTSEA